MPDLHVVILAAGKSTRMKSARPKVLHDLAGRPLIAHVLGTVADLPATTTTLVVGHEADAVKAVVSRETPAAAFALQSPQLGTGHALLQTESLLRDRAGTVLLLAGDVPLLTSATLARLLETHHARRATATVLTMKLADPYGYGRIVRAADGRVARIVEERDASAVERTIAEVNSGIYAFALPGLFAALHALATDNAQGEYYVTDLIAGFVRGDKRVESVCVDDPDELRGVNSRVELAEIAAILRARKNRALMLSGVTLEDPATTYIDEGVAIGADTTIGPSVRLQGKTSIGARCRIHAGTRLTDVTLADDVTILDHSIVVQSVVEESASIGPFAHVRPESRVGKRVRIGNFVELKKTSMGEGAKANHLAYLGDATIGRDVNIGAGTITCNYDGEKKHPTIIEDGVFIGSDSQLIAPVVIGKGAYVGAGSSITKDVPAGALAVARGKQIVKEGWVQRKKGTA